MFASSLDLKPGKLRLNQCQRLGVVRVLDWIMNRIRVVLGKHMLALSGIPDSKHRRQSWPWSAPTWNVFPNSRALGRIIP